MDVQNLPNVGDEWRLLDYKSVMEGRFMQVKLVSFDLDDTLIRPLCIAAAK